MLGRLVRHLSRRSRIPRPVRWALAAVLGAAALLGLAGPPRTATAQQPPTAAQQPAAAVQASRPAAGRAPALPNPGSVKPVAKLTKPPDPPGAGNPTQRIPDTPVMQAAGYNLYQQSCASCHGVMLQGRKGVAPSLIDIGAGPPLFYLTTGRMPLANPRQEPVRERPLFTRTEIDALVDYILRFGGPDAPSADPSKGMLSEGYSVFTLNCAGCHQIVARGGMTVGALVPNLSQATPDQIAEAIRMGPYLMPRFSAQQINQRQLDSLARYVEYTRHPDNAGGWGIYNIGPIPEGLVAWFIGLFALVIVARLIGERAA
jgi:ubiquinol-cytochrome c reductase cytochrome c subunit